MHTWTHVWKWTLPSHPSPTPHTCAHTHSQTHTNCAHIVCVCARVCACMCVQVWCARNTVLRLYIIFEVLCTHFSWPCKMQCAHPYWWNICCKSDHYYTIILLLHVHSLFYVQFACCDFLFACHGVCVCVCMCVCVHACVCLLYFYSKVWIRI